MTDPCSGFTTASSCLSSNIDSTTSNCVWKNSVCLTDPCLALSSTMDLCVANADCTAISQGGSGSLLCFSMQRVCSYLGTTVCQLYPWCLKSPPDGCTYYEPGQGSSGQSFTSCLSFPTWSIAIIILWVLVMAILGGIVGLAIRQRRLDAITEVEESEVYVEHQREDHFVPQPGKHPLERPLK